MKTELEKYKKQLLGTDDGINDPLTLGEKILEKGFKDNSKTIRQLENLRDWSLDPVKYVENMNKGKSYGEALENSKNYINNPKKLESLINSEDPALRNEQAGIKDSTLYKLLENPKVLGVELGHESIIELINLIQNSGIVKKPKPTNTKYAQRMSKLDSLDAMYQSMTPIERGQFNFDLRKRYGNDYIRFKNNNKNIK